jgi:hypothetical protein
MRIMFLNNLVISWRLLGDSGDWLAILARVTNGVEGHKGGYLERLD